MLVEELMNQYYATFNENDKYIAQCILKYRKQCIQQSISEFADMHHISKSSLSRFAQKMNLPGYSELRSMLRMNQKNHFDTPSSFADTAIENYHAMVNELKQRDFHTVFHCFDQAERILIFANGYAQARVASEMKRIFLPLHKIIYDISGQDMALSFKQMITEGDLVILISLDGKGDDIVSIAKTTRVRNIDTISITRMDMNELTKLCPINLYIHSLTVPNDYDVSYEIATPYFILIEMLYLKYQEYLCTAHNFK